MECRRGAVETLLWRAPHDEGVVYARVAGKILAYGLLGYVLYADLCAQKSLNVWLERTQVAREQA